MKTKFQPVDQKHACRNADAPTMSALQVTEAAICWHGFNGFSGGQHLRRRSKMRAARKEVVQTLLRNAVKDLGTYDFDEVINYFVEEHCTPTK